VADFFFRIRGYTPVPFIIAALYWANFEPINLITGALLSLSGEMLRLRSISYAGGATRTRNVGAPFLVTTGPYALVRNPLYLANMFIYTGYAIASGSLLPWLSIIVFLFFSIQYLLIIKLEEITLIEIFGQEYRDYCERVPRLLPRFSGIDTRGSANLSLGETFRQEKRTLQGFLTVWILLILRFAFI